MAGTPESVVYERIVSTADQQTETLRDLRGRAATIFSAASVTTAFLAGQALGNGESFSGLAWAAVVAYMAVGLLTILILWPVGWLSALDPQIMLKDIDAEKLSEADLQRFLATVIDENVDTNQRILDPLFWLFRGSCIALLVEVVLWLALLATQ